MTNNVDKVPYYAVIFTSTKNTNVEGYAEMAKRMEELAKEQPGFLSVDSAREEVGITVSYWKDIDSLKAWKKNSEHRIAQEKGKKDWYKSYTVRVAKVEHEYGTEW